METTAWTEKYRPKNLGEVIGNENQIKLMVEWITQFRKDSTNCKKILLLCGPPGVGKTTLAHLLLEDHGYRVLEFNASDNRRAKTLHDILKKSVCQLNVIDMMFGNPQSSGLVLDEIDGLKGSDSDRGGLTELLRFINKRKNKKLHTPIICTYNPFSSKSLTKLKSISLYIHLKKPSRYCCKKLMKKIIEQEHIPIKEDGEIQILNHLTGDMRNIINGLWFLKRNGTIFNEKIVKEFFQNTMKKDIKPKLFNSVTRVLRDNKLTIHECITMNRLNLQIPLLLHENYPQIIEKVDNKFEIHNKIMDGIILHDIIQNQIFKNHDWSLSPYCAVVNLFNINMLLSSLKVGYRVNIKSADSLNKIQQSNTNLKAPNAIRLKLRLNLYDNDLIHLAELLCALLFDRVKKTEMPGDEHLNKLTDILKSYKIYVDDINNIIKLNRYSSDNYTFGGKYYRHVILHILRERLKSETDVCQNNIEGLLKIMCPYFTACKKNENKLKKDKLLKIRFKKIVKTMETYNITDHTLIKHLLRNDLIRRE